MDDSVSRALSPTQPPLDPDQREVELFWEEARKVSGLEDMDIYMGQRPVASLQPPAMAFGDTAELATELVGLVIDGTKTATAGPLSDYDPEVATLVVQGDLEAAAEVDPAELSGEPLPEPGSMWIACDGGGHPRALVETRAVDVVPFDEVSVEHAAAEGEGDLSLDYWRRAHVRFLPGFEGRPVDEPWPDGEEWPSDLMVLERIRCVFPTDPKGFLDLF